jgi:hypothetical protein
MVAAAGNIDCIHCHGPEYDGMLAEWQGAVSAQLSRLGPAIAELKVALGEDRASAAATDVVEAEQNYLLVSLDGSKGAHNVTYALDALRAAAERVDRARAALSRADGASAAAGFPFASAEGCTSCHAAIGLEAELSKAERAFPHRKHLADAMQCSACHSVAEHGEPAFPRNECSTCHHQENERFDVSECSRCHTAQDSMLRGTLSHLSEPKPGTMGEMECSECHGEAPSILRPKPQMCVLCHEAGYDEMSRNWGAELETLAGRVRAALDAPGSTSDALARARRALAAVDADGSHGAHNFELAKTLLEDALRALAEH